MIGALQQVISNPAPTAPPLSGFVSPGAISRNPPNGSYTSSIITMSASGGEPPYSYVWSIVSGEGELVQTDENQTRVSISGYNELKICNVQCTVTDNLAAEVTDDVFLAIEFGEAGFA